MEVCRRTCSERLYSFSFSMFTLCTHTSTRLYKLSRHPPPAPCVGTWPVSVSFTHSMHSLPLTHSLSVSQTSLNLNHLLTLSVTLPHRHSLTHSLSDTPSRVHWHTMSKQSGKHSPLPPFLTCPSDPLSASAGIARPMRCPLRRMSKQSLALSLPRRMSKQSRALSLPLRHMSKQSLALSPCAV
jgi:hypothetical protein